jgi:hypothetical protein
MTLEYEVKAPGVPRSKKFHLLIPNLVVSLVSRKFVSCMMMTSFIWISSRGSMLAFVMFEAQKYLKNCGTIGGRRIDVSLKEKEYISTPPSPANAQIFLLGSQAVLEWLINLENITSFIIFTPWWKKKLFLVERIKPRLISEI